MDAPDRQIVLRGQVQVSRTGFEKHCATIHQSFADDFQLHMSVPPDKISELLHFMQSCMSNVNAWATANMLKLNDSKT